MYEAEWKRVEAEWKRVQAVALKEAELVLGDLDDEYEQEKKDRDADAQLELARQMPAPWQRARRRWQEYLARAHHMIHRGRQLESVKRRHLEHAQRSADRLGIASIQPKDTRRLRNGWNDQWRSSYDHLGREKLWWVSAELTLDFEVGWFVAGMSGAVWAGLRGYYLENPDPAHAKYVALLLTWALVGWIYVFFGWIVASKIRGRTLLVLGHPDACFCTTFWVLMLYGILAVIRGLAGQSWWWASFAPVAALAAHFLIVEPRYFASLDESGSLVLLYAACRAASEKEKEARLVQVFP